MEIPRLNYSHILWDFARTLGPTVEYIKMGHSLCEQIVTVLRRKLCGSSPSLNYKINWRMECGVPAFIPEYHIFVGLKNRSINKENVMTHMINLLTQYCHALCIAPGSIELESKYSLKVLLTYGIRVNLTLALEETLMYQYQKDYEQFLAEQSDFTQHLVHLMKVWFGMKRQFFNLEEDHWKVLELITVAAALVEENQNSDNFLVAFKRALNLMASIDQIHLQIVRQEKEIWDVLSHCDIKLTLKKENAAKWVVQAPFKQEVCLLDPINETNILTEVKMDQSIQSIQKFGKAALSGLHSLESNVNTVKYKKRFIIELGLFFEPLAPICPSRRAGFPRFYRLQFQDFSESGQFNQVVIHDEEVMKDDDAARAFIYKMRENLIAFIGCIMRQGYKNNELQENLERNVRKFMKRYLLHTFEDENVEDWHASISLPYWVIEDDVRCCQISFSFN